jgi:hypothetical protein
MAQQNDLPNNIMQEGSSLLREKNQGSQLPIRRDMYNSYPANNHTNTIISYLNNANKKKKKLKKKKKKDNQGQIFASLDH